MDTTDKSLKARAIDIKGKEYVLVKDRVLYFNEVYPNGSITTERLSEWDREIIKAVVYPDCDKPNRFFTGYSQAQRGKGLINQTAALENCESSAVGRALAFLGIGVIDSIASVDEINKAENSAKVEENKAEDTKEELPRFNKPEIEKLKGATEYLKKFEKSADLIDDLLTKFRISNDRKREIADVWASVK